MKNKNLRTAYTAAFFICVTFVVGYPVISAQPSKPADEGTIALINNYEAKIKELVQELSLLRGSLSSFTWENEKLQGELASLKLSWDEANAQLEILQDTNSQLIQSKVSLEKQVKDLNKAVGQVTVERDFQLTQYQDDLNKSKKAEQEVKNETQELTKQNTWLKEQYVNNNKVNDDLKQQILVLQKERQTYAASLAQSERKIKELEAENEILFKQNQEMSSSLKENSVKLREKDQLEKRNDTVRQAYLQLKDNFQQLEKQYKQLQDAGKDKEMNQLKAKLGGLEAALKNSVSAKDYSELKIKSQDLEAQLAKLQNTHQQLGQQHKQLQDANNLSAAQLQDLKSKSGRLESVSKELDGLKQDYAKLKETYEKLAKDKASLEAKMEKENVSSRLSKVMQRNDELAKENSILHYNLGVCFTQAQDFNKAVLEFEKVLKLNPNDSETHYNLGVIYAEQIQNSAKAIEHFKKYLTLSPQDVDADRARRYIMTHETLEGKGG
ncbi:MAG: hypothetical protein A3K83_03075 [Omnitrophica WOR_2 bacterium RBG_13_44_8b]|nr:MAG: hypothetical protein A3K83_03075 [Omnitrophica WOR_2 bacterium RBG_13_44_8b]